MTKSSKRRSKARWTSTGRGAAPQIAKRPSRGKPSPISSGGRLTMTRFAGRHWTRRRRDRSLPVPAGRDPLGHTTEPPSKGERRDASPLTWNRGSAHRPVARGAGRASRACTRRRAGSCAGSARRPSASRRARRVHDLGLVIKPDAARRLIGQGWLSLRRERAQTSQAGSPSAGSPRQAAGSAAPSTTRTWLSSGPRRGSARSREEAPVDEEEMRLGVLEDEPDLLGLEPRVDRAGDGAERPDRQVRQKVGAVEDRMLTRVPCPTHVREHVGDRADAAAHLGVAERLARLRADEERAPRHARQRAPR